MRIIVLVVLVMAVLAGVSAQNFRNFFAGFGPFTNLRASLTRDPRSNRETASFHPQIMVRCCSHLGRHPTQLTPAASSWARADMDSCHPAQVTSLTSTTKHPAIEGLQEDDSAREMVVKVSDVTARRLQLDIVVDYKWISVTRWCVSIAGRTSLQVLLFFFFLFNNSLSPVIGGVGVRLLLVNFARLRKVRRVKENY